MSLAYSSMITPNKKFSDFKLLNVIDNKEINTTNYSKFKPVVIAFICNHCPYVKHILNRFTEVGNNYSKKGFVFIAISSNDYEQYPEDSPEKMKDIALIKGFKFFYCYDGSQRIARLYQAVCTPDLYCFNQDHKLVYRGQFDSSRPNNSIPVTGQDLTSVMDNILRGEEIKVKQEPSIGCSIKWKKSI